MHHNQHQETKLVIHTNYYGHLNEDGQLMRLYIAEVDTSDEQRLLSFAGLWNQEQLGTIQRVEHIFRIDGQAIPPEFYPPQRRQGAQKAPSMLGR